MRRPLCPDQTRTPSSAPPVTTRRLSLEIAADTDAAMRIDVQFAAAREVDEARAPSRDHHRTRRVRRDRRTGSFVTPGDLDDHPPSAPANPPVASGDESSPVVREGRVVRRSTPVAG